MVQPLRAIPAINMEKRSEVSKKTVDQGSWKTVNPASGWAAFVYVMVDKSAEEELYAELRN